MYSPIPFKPLGGSTISIACTSVSASNATLSSNYDCVRLYNAGPNTAFVRFSTVASTADSTVDTPIPSGSVEVFSKAGATVIAAVCAATQTATLFVTVGEGT